MPVVVLALDDVVKELPNVMEQGVLPFIQEHGGRGVERLQVHQSVTYPTLPNDLIDAISDIQHLHPVLSNPIENSAEDLIVALRNRLWRRLNELKFRRQGLGGCHFRKSVAQLDAADSVKTSSFQELLQDAIRTIFYNL